MMHVRLACSLSMFHAMQATYCYLAVTYPTDRPPITAITAAEPYFLHTTPLRKATTTALTMLPNTQVHLNFLGIVCSLVAT